MFGKRVSEVEVTMGGGKQKGVGAPFGKKTNWEVEE